MNTIKQELAGINRLYELNELIGQLKPKEVGVLGGRRFHLENASGDISLNEIVALFKKLNKEDDNGKKSEIRSSICVLEQESKKQLSHSNPLTKALTKIRDFFDRLYLSNWRLKVWDNEEILKLVGKGISDNSLKRQYYIDEIVDEACLECGIPIEQTKNFKENLYLSNARNVVSDLSELPKDVKKNFLKALIYSSSQSEIEEIRTKVAPLLVAAYAVVSLDEFDAEKQENRRNFLNKMEIPLGIFKTWKLKDQPQLLDNALHSFDVFYQEDIL